MEKNNQEKRVLKIGFITLSQEVGTASEFHKTIRYTFVAILIMALIFTFSSTTPSLDINIKPKEIINNLIQKIEPEA